MRSESMSTSRTSPQSHGRSRTAAAVARPFPHQFIFSPPVSPKLDSPPRPSPAASPAGADLAATASGTEEPAAAPEDKAKLETRRKSTPWKTFNLKRQLSKVDLKFKAAFAVPTENNLEEATEKSNSQFYCETEEELDVTPVAAVAPATESPDGEEIKLTEVIEDTNKPADKSELSSPLRVCSDVFERMHKELQEKRSSDVYDRMHKELQERWQDKERGEASPDISPSRVGEEKPARPDNLPLFEEDGRPTRPPRQKGKVKKEEAERRDMRDQRLLSVPNIKYSKQESVRDLRRKQSAASQPPSFAGNLMRRFSKYPAIPRIHCSSHHTSDITNAGSHESPLRSTWNVSVR